jgi:hypothetical protein
VTRPTKAPVNPAEGSMAYRGGRKLATVNTVANVKDDAAAGLARTVLLTLP